MATYVQMLTSWMWDLSLNDHLPATDEIYQRILDCAEKNLEFIISENYFNAME